MKVKVGNSFISLDTLDWQEGSLGKPFRQYRLRRNGQMPEKWLQGTWKSHWIYTFTYQDDKEFEIEIGYNNEFIRLTKL